jgi:site-specific recombinase XerD
MKYEISNELKALQDQTLENLKNSKSKNTVRAYKSDFKDFEFFCAKLNMKSLPSDPKVVSLYLTNLSQLSFKTSTIRRRLVSIATVHKHRGFYIDIKNPIITENFLGIKRKIGVYQKGKKPLLYNNIKEIIDVMDINIVNELQLHRDRSILLLGFSGGFRRSEIVSVDYEDLEFVEEGLKITIKRSKTDQLGAGLVKGIPFSHSEKYCPVKSLKKYLEKSKITKGPVFRSLLKGSLASENRLTDQSIAIVVKKYLELVGLNKNQYSGHSLRSGFATSTAAAGADERSIMTMTGHKSTEMVRRYIKEANLFKNNALNKLNI